MELLTGVDKESLIGWQSEKDSVALESGETEGLYDDGSEGCGVCDGPDGGGSGNTNWNCIGGHPRE